MLKRIKPVGEVLLASAAGASATPATLPARGGHSGPTAGGIGGRTPRPAGGKPDGKKTYDATCAVCHGAGVAGAPKFGDKAVWAPRLKTGIDTLYSSAIKGKGAMPAKGGNASLRGSRT